MTVADAVGVISTVLTLITVIANVVLTWFTRQMVQSMESVREPFVDIELNMPETYLRFVFVNSGGSAARNIRFRVVQDPQCIKRSNDDKGIASIHPIKNGISYLPAGQRLMYMAGRFAGARDETNSRLTIALTYTNDSGRVFTRTVEYDLRQIEGLLFESFQNTNVAVARAIRETEQSKDSRNRARAHFSKRLERAAQRSCPHCSEMILKTAQKCRHCHERLKPERMDGVSDGDGDDLPEPFSPNPSEPAT